MSDVVDIPTWPGEISFLLPWSSQAREEQCDKRNTRRYKKICPRINLFNKSAEKDVVIWPLNQMPRQELAK